jgi:hypothetical protein
MALGGVLVALVFSAWRFEPENTAAAAPPATSAPADFHQLPAVHIHLIADGKGHLSTVFLNGRAVRGMDDLRAQIKAFRGPAADATVEAELDCDGKLRYEDTQRTIAAISNYQSADGRTSVPLVDRVKFLPRKAPAASR